MKTNSTNKQVINEGENKNNRAIMEVLNAVETALEITKDEQLRQTIIKDLQ